MSNKDVLASDLIARRNAAICELLEAGVELDENLIQELNSAGSDMRFGVNLICRPTKDVIEYIKDVQDYLRDIEPDQYYYPWHDLHLTLFEICHSQDLDVASRIANAIHLQIGRIIKELPEPYICSTILSLDRRGAAIAFLRPGSGLELVRNSLHEALTKLEVSISPRYITNSAHITVMRYIKPLTSDTRKWVTTLLNAPQRPDLCWSLSSAWLTWGAKWYGMQSRIKKSGPYAFSD